MNDVRVSYWFNPGSRCACVIGTCLLFSLSGRVPLLAVLAPQSPEAISEAKQQTSDDLIDFWISQLTSDHFGTRESARNHLLNGGAQVLPYLEKHLDATNNELRLSIARLHEIISDKVSANQIDAFLDNKSSLAGWPIFRTYFGDTDENRLMYSDVFRTNQEVLEQIERADGSLPEILGRLIRNQQRELAHSSRPEAGQLPVLAMVVSELFGTREQSAPAETPGASLQLQISLAQLVTDPDFRRWIDERQPTVEIVLRSITSWITHTTSSPILVSSKINVASLLQLPEAVPLCLQCLDSRDVPAANRRTAMELLVRFGDNGHFKALEKHIEDSLIVYRESPDASNSNARKAGTCRMGDIALASLIMMSGQDLKRYGFINTDITNGKMLPSANQLVFYDDSARLKARKQWREYRAARID